MHFFGSHDYAFVHRGQVFNYHEGVRLIFSSFFPFYYLLEQFISVFVFVFNYRIKALRTLVKKLLQSVSKQH